MKQFTVTGVVLAVVIDLGLLLLVHCVSYVTSFMESFSNASATSSNILQR